MTIFPGFADPVTDSQKCFRVVLDALSRPGTVHRVAAPCPPSLDPATSAVLLTLLDGETPVWLAEEYAAARDWISFHCGSSFVGLDAASFAVALAMPDFSEMHAGSDEAPEDGATLVLQVLGFDEGMALRLSGPGLAAPSVLRVNGLPADFVARWRSNHARYPRGVDIILCAGDRLAALPRSVQIEVA